MVADNRLYSEDENYFFHSAVRSTKKHFYYLNSALQDACDNSIARVTGGVYPREGYRSVTPLLLPGSTTPPRRSVLFCAPKLYNPH